MRCIKLYATGAATANAVASITIPSRSRLVAIQAAVGVDQVADNSQLALELSRSSSTELGTNGSQQSIWILRAYANGVTPSGNVNGFYPVNVDLDQGQILYLHAVVTTSTYYCELLLWLA